MCAALEHRKMSVITVINCQRKEIALHLAIVSVHSLPHPLLLLFCHYCRCGDGCSLPLTPILQLNGHTGRPNPAQCLHALPSRTTAYRRLSQAQLRAIRGSRLASVSTVPCIAASPHRKAPRRRQCRAAALP